MKGLELSALYYKEVGRPAIEAALPEALPLLAAGLAGEGSECLGYDDEISRDHDFGPSFCLWLREEDFTRYGKQLDGIYRSLPGDYLGVPARHVMPQGGGRVGVMRTADFYRKFTGCAGLPGSDLQWLRIPEHFLRQVTNGEVFEDGPGEFSAIRRGYMAYYPEDVRRKKLAARAVAMAQAGQYNFPRAYNRGDEGAAFLAVSEFVKAAISMAHLLCRRYTPYYKWMFRSFSELPLYAGERETLAAMIRQPLSPVNANRIEAFCAETVRIWQEQGLTAKSETFLEPQAWELFRQIRSDELRRLHILEG